MSFITEQIKDWIKNDENLQKFLKEDNFSDAYSYIRIKAKSSNVEIDDRYVSAFTSILMNANIDFLSHMTYICPGMFYGIRDITSIEIPDNIIHIYPRAFKACKNLKTVKLSNNLETIDIKAFSECENLSEIVSGIPKTVKQIGERAFWGCESLKELTFKHTATDIRVNIDSKAFAFCDDLKSISLPYTFLIITNAFYGCDDLDFIYPGTSDEFYHNVNILSFGGHWNTHLDEIEVRCSDKTIKISLE